MAWAGRRLRRRRRSVYENTEREYRRAVRAGELGADDQAATRALLDRMEARDYFRHSGSTTRKGSR
jgi:hypothetical protein